LIRTGKGEKICHSDKIAHAALGVWYPRRQENLPSPPFDKGGLGGFKDVYLTKPESGYFKASWTRAFAGVTGLLTFYGIIRD
jgi:hypothetical protein